MHRTSTTTTYPSTVDLHVRVRAGFRRRTKRNLDGIVCSVEEEQAMFEKESKHLASLI